MRESEKGRGGEKVPMIRLMGKKKMETTKNEERERIFLVEKMTRDGCYK